MTRKLETLITQQILDDALNALDEKSIIAIAKKVIPKLIQEHIEDQLNDYLQQEVDFYDVFCKCKLDKKVASLITESIKGI